jgi:hypothetical protein
MKGVRNEENRAMASVALFMAASDMQGSSPTVYRYERAAASYEKKPCAVTTHGLRYA